MSEHLEQVQAWWQELGPGAQDAVQSGGFLLMALVAGHLLGLIVSRALRRRNFDAALRLPGSPVPTVDAPQAITPTLLGGWLVRLSIWAAAAWWLAYQHGRTELAHTISLVLSRSWAFAAVIVTGLALGSALAQRLVAWLDAGKPVDPYPSRHGPAAVHKSAAGIVGAGVYAMVVLIVLLIGADAFDWPLTRASAAALWQLTQHMLVAGAALMIGLVGARWARDMAAEAAATPEKRAGQYTALGVVAATTVLAVAVLLSSAGVLIGLAALAILAFLLWLARGYLPDVVAGLQLRTQSIREVFFDGIPWQVTAIGMVTTQIGRNGEFCTLQNRQVLEACLHRAPTEPTATR